MLPGRPDDHEISDYFKKYISQTPDDILNYLKNQLSRFESFVAKIEPEKWSYRYQENKWSLKEVLVHVNDTERIFAYRALTIARGDKVNLPGYEQDDYINSSMIEKIDPKLLVQEFIHLRKSNLALFQSFGAEQWNNINIVSNNNLSARAAVFIIAGHLDHHLKIIQERYL